MSDNIVVIPAGVDIHTFHPLTPEAGKLKGGLSERYIFCLSRIDSNKGHDLLLNSFDVARRAVPDIHLVIGGGSPKPQQRELEILAEIRKLIDEKGLHKKVHVVGYIPDDLLVTYYQRAELFVLPSVFEPFGMTTLEAMACSTPVAASRLGGIRDVIENKKNGLLVDPRNVDEFTGAIMTLLNDQQLARILAREGLKTILRYYSWDAIADTDI